MNINRSHIPRLPAFTYHLRYAQLVVALIILGLSAYVFTYFVYPGATLSLFTAIATLIITVYNIFTIEFRPDLYNYWAVIGLEIFAVIFWLISFALVASEAAARAIITPYSDNCAYSPSAYCYRKRALVQKRSTGYRTHRNAMAAGAGLGALEFVLFVVTLGFTVFAALKHRRMGGPSVPNPEVDHVAAEHRDLETLAPPQSPTEPISLRSHFQSHHV